MARRDPMRIAYVIWIFRRPGAKSIGAPSYVKRCWRSLDDYRSKLRQDSSGCLIQSAQDGVGAKNLALVRQHPLKRLAD
jgi:hypothetical protein